MLSQDLDGTYADGGNPDVQLHQADHDVLHRYLWRPPQNYSKRIPNQKMIWGGQSGHGHTTFGTGATFNLDDTTDFVLGDRSSRMTTGGTNAQTYIEKTGLTGVDITNRVVRLWLKLDNYTANCDFRFWIGSGTGWTNYYSWALMDNAVDYKIYPLGGESAWVQVTLPRSKATTTGTPDQANISRYRLVLYDQNTAMTVRLGGVATQPNTTALYPNGVVSFTFDDALADHYTQAKRYMDRYGFAGTCYPIVDRIGTANYMTLTQLKSLHIDSYWEIGLHAYTAANHNTTGGFTGLSANELVKDIAQQREWLVTNGFPDPVNLAYPQGAFNQSVKNTLAPWVNSARMTKSGQLETWPPADRMRLFTRAAANTDTAANFTALIDSAVANKEWQIFTFHQLVASAPPGTGTTTAIFQAIVDYANTSGVAVRTVGEVLAASAGA